MPAAILLEDPFWINLWFSEFIEADVSDITK